MNKQQTLKLINPLLGATLIVQAVTGMCYSLIPYEFFKPIHTVAGFSLVFFGIVHLILNWGWVKANYVRKKR